LGLRPSEVVGGGPKVKREAVTGRGRRFRPFTLRDGSSMRRLSLLFALVLPLLSGCETLGLTDSSDATDPANAAIPACPPTAVLTGADEVTKLRPGTPATAGRNPADIMFSAEMSQARVDDCSYDRDTNKLTVDIHFAVRVTRGPAAGAMPPPLDYFIAIIDTDNNVVMKQVYHNPAQLTAGTTTMVEDLNDFPVPLAMDKRPSDYEVLTGFQLTPAELAYNELPRSVPMTGAPPRP
jgi:hypothetical protein